MCIWIYIFIQYLYSGIQFYSEYRDCPEDLLAYMHNVTKYQWYMTQSFTHDLLELLLKVSVTDRKDNLQETS